MNTRNKVIKLHFMTLGLFNSSKSRKGLRFINKKSKNSFNYNLLS